MTPVVLPDTQESPQATIVEIMESLNHLPPKRLDDVLQFIQFLEYRLVTADDPSEDEALWHAVEANDEYKRQHPQEPLERFESGAEFLKALADL